MLCCAAGRVQSVLGIRSYTVVFLCVCIAETLALWLIVIGLLGSSFMLISVAIYSSGVSDLNEINAEVMCTPAVQQTMNGSIACVLSLWWCDAKFNRVDKTKWDSSMRMIL